jgi:hypothetical protein
MDQDPLLYDPLREVHRNVYGDVPRKTAAAAPVVNDQKDIPTAEIPIPRPPQQPGV